ncbi:MAG: Hsp20 family protein [Kordiimonadaceae bacterium]|nr:Hsp20 family protein [Kordiimonadaceae bacterium]
MRNFDLTPLMRSSVGFDHLSRLVDSALTNDSATAYPPYNIEKISEDDYQITMAVAGFAPEELHVTVQEGTLLIAGRALDEAGERSFLHRGIAKRAFERNFELAETIQVGDARYENGLLQIDLKRVIPDHKKPRNVEIRSNAEKAPSVQSIKASAA